MFGSNENELVFVPFYLFVQMQIILIGFLDLELFRISFLPSKNFLKCHEASATRHLGAVGAVNCPRAVLGQSRQLGYFKLVLSHFEMFF